VAAVQRALDRRGKKAALAGGSGAS